MKNLKKEFHYYLDHQNELVKKFNGKYLVIKDFTVLGNFDSISEALDNASKVLGLKMGEFLIQKCSPGESDYTQTFHSRVHFEKTK